MWPGKCPFSFRARHNDVSGRLLLSTAHLLFRRLGAAVCQKGFSRSLRSPALRGPSAEPVCGRPEQPATGLSPTASCHATRGPCSASSAYSALGLGRKGGRLHLRPQSAYLKSSWRKSSISGLTLRFPVSPSSGSRPGQRRPSETQL